MQLDGTLHSFLRHCQDLDEIHLTVIFKASDSFHARQYAQLSAEYATQRICFVQQHTFRHDVLTLLAPTTADAWTGNLQRLAVRLGLPVSSVGHRRLSSDQPRYVLFLVDDNIFVRDFSLREACEALTASAEALGFSLRLGQNTGHCYTANRLQSLPPFAPVSGSVLSFDWTTADGDFSYPLEVSSSLYRVNDILPVLNRSPFKNPNALEVQMAARAGLFRDGRPRLLCYEQSVTFCNPLNMVQTTYRNRASGRPEYSSAQLAQLFEQGHRIDVAAYAGFVPNGCHQEAELCLEKAGENT